MGLTRVDYIIMKLLKKKGSTSYFESMTLKEIMGTIKISRPTLYRKRMDLRKYGYVEKDVSQRMQILFIYL